MCKKNDSVKLNKSELQQYIHATIDNDINKYEQYSAFARVCMKRKWSESARKCEVYRFVDRWGGSLRNKVVGFFSWIKPSCVTKEAMFDAVLSWVNDYIEDAEYHAANIA